MGCWYYSKCAVYISIATREAKSCQCLQRQLVSISVYNNMLLLIGLPSDEMFAMSLFQLFLFFCVKDLLFQCVPCFFSPFVVNSTREKWRFGKRKSPRPLFMYTSESNLFLGLWTIGDRQTCRKTWTIINFATFFICLFSSFFFTNEKW